MGRTATGKKKKRSGKRPLLPVGSEWTVRIDSLTLDPENTNKHTESGIARVAAMLRRFGQQRRIIVDPRGVVRAGNGVLLAAKKLGQETIQVVVTDLTGDELRAFAISDNRSTDFSKLDIGKTYEAISALEDPSLASAAGYDERELQALARAQSKVDKAGDGQGVSRSKLQHECPSCGHTFTAKG